MVGRAALHTRLCRPPATSFGIVGRTRCVAVACRVSGLSLQHASDDVFARTRLRYYTEVTRSRDKMRRCHPDTAHSGAKLAELGSAPMVLIRSSVGICSASPKSRRVRAVGPCRPCIERQRPRAHRSMVRPGPNSAVRGGIPANFGLESGQSRSIPNRGWPTTVEFVQSQPTWARQRPSAPTSAPPSAENAPRVVGDSTMGG